MFKQTDGGVPNTLRHERLDCSVRAVAIAAEILYSISHRLHAERGRRDRHATKRGTWLEIVKLFKKTTWFISDAKTVKTFLLSKKQGVFVLQLSGHVTVVKDGILYDKYFCKNKRIQGIYKIESK